MCHTWHYLEAISNCTGWTSRNLHALLRDRDANCLKSLVLLLPQVGVSESGILCYVLCVC